MMLGILRRVLTRQYPSVNKMNDCFVRVSPVNLSRARISSSCVNFRRIKYDTPRKIDIDADDTLASETEIHDEDPTKATLTRSKRRATEYISDSSDEDEQPARTSLSRFEKKNTGYNSDDSDNDEDAVLRKPNHLNFTVLPRGSQAVRDEMILCRASLMKRFDSCLVKEFDGVKQIMQNGIVPKKIFFTRLSDLINLDMNLKGIKLYKIHPQDAPLGMQNKKDPPFFAVVDAEEMVAKPLQAPTSDSIPITIIYDSIRNFRKMVPLMAAAMVCRCSRILFTSDFASLFPHYNVRITGQLINNIPLEFSQSWSDIDSRLGADVSVFVMSLQNPDNFPADLTIVDLTDINFWKKKEIALIMLHSLSEEAENFCRWRNAQFISVKGANDFFYNKVMIGGAVAFEMFKQWEAKTKVKSKAKVNIQV